MASAWSNAWARTWGAAWDRASAPAGDEVASLEYEVRGAPLHWVSDAGPAHFEAGARLHWSASGNAVHYTMNPARAHYDA